MLTRRQFRELGNSWKPGLGDWDSPLWIPESVTNKRSRYFVVIPPVADQHYDNFRLWCRLNCRGQILCYSLSDQEAWYGFSHRADVAWFLLKWA